ncbi:MAG TPA: 30S ribosomal protein S8 [Candidatus Campbellbacteria bacterium]|nr:30S ribosomal protein S8 [Candidatus Campbellbacteria bacterium]
MDNIADMLTIIRNAQAVKKETVFVPYSKFKMAIVEILAREGFIKEAVRRGKKNKKIISIVLKYDEKEVPAISHVTRISKLSRRIYLPLNKIHAARARRTLRILTTPKGVLTDKEAHKEKVGGEVICEIN